LDSISNEEKEKLKDDPILKQILICCEEDPNNREITMEQLCDLFSKRVLDQQPTSKLSPSDLIKQTPTKPIEQQSNVSSPKRQIEKEVTSIIPSQKMKLDKNNNSSYLPLDNIYLNINSEEKLESKEEVKFKINSKSPALELVNQAVDKCLQTQHSELVSVMCNLFNELEKLKEPDLIDALKKELIPLGLDPTSQNYGWTCDPDREALINVITQIQDKLNKLD